MGLVCVLRLEDVNFVNHSSLSELNVEEGRGHLTAKTMHAYKYVYDHHFNDADWFMKADDDTFVIVENLRHFLSDKDPNEPVYHGHHFKALVKPQGYHSGGMTTFDVFHLLISPLKI